MVRTMKARLLALLALSLVLVGVAVVRLDVSRRAQAHTLIEDQEAQASTVFDDLVGLRTRFLQQLAYDYSYWDDLVDFVRSPDSSWASEALDPILRNYGANALWLYDAQGTRVYARAYGKGGREQLDEHPVGRTALSSVLGAARFTHFFTYGPRGLMEIRGATIHPGTDESRVTQPRGYLFFGLLWDEGLIRELEGLTASTITVMTPDAHSSGGDLPADPARIWFERDLTGWNHAVIARLSVLSRVPGVDTFLRASRQYILLTVAFVTGLVILAVLVVTRWVTTPLRSISRSLARDDPSHVQRLQNDRSEFGDIASLIARFFDQRTQLKRENTERRRVEEALTVSHRFLEIANRHREMEPLLREFAHETEQFTGCTLAGIHLSFNQGGPRYEMTVGFGENTVAHDRPCAKSEVRGICRAIMAGDSRVPPQFTTPGGSCVMNQASHDLASVLGQLHWDICTRCWRLGYESVALVPIRVQDKTLGLIEVADQRQDMLPVHRVEALEAVAKQLGIAVLRVKAEERLAFMATHDLLTGLPNRAMVGFRLRPAIATARERNERVAVMMLDLDYFKSINDTLGHAAGDRLLQAASQRITDILRRTDTAVRMGGDEFMIILPQVATPDDASKVASKILEGLRRPFQIDDRELRVTGSIGIALYPDGGCDIDTLLKHADIAMYHAKGQGRNTFCTYTNEATVEE